MNNIIPSSFSLKVSILMNQSMKMKVKMVLMPILNNRKVIMDSMAILDNRRLKMSSMAILMNRKIIMESMSTLDNRKVMDAECPKSISPVVRIRNYRNQ